MPARHFRSTILVAVVTSVSCRGVPVPAPESHHEQIRSEIELQLVPAPPDLIHLRRDREHLVEELTEFYRVRDHFPVWYEHATFSEAGRAVLQTLRRADEHGLRVDDYVNGILANDDVFDDQQNAQEAAGLDITLSAATMRYVKDLHEGRVAPEQLGLDLMVTHHHPKLSVELVEVGSSPGYQVSVRLESFAPPYDSYRRLKRALALYRDLEANDRWQPLVADKVLHPGESYDQLEDLGDRLRRTGDLAESVKPLGPGYDGDLVVAVNDFQTRHGLNPDGVIGTQTFAELNTPWSHRVEQIIASMERWRWVSGHFDGKAIIVNIPEFELRGLEGSGSQRQVSFGSRVIVGRHYDRLRTPIFTAELGYIDFRPFWNVPASIIRDELAEKLDVPGFLDRNDYEIVRDTSLEAEPLPATPENTARVRAGTLRLRQRPGPRNALGLVKFIFPNPHSVFLHSTPAVHLFQRQERAFSHGCVRVADALDLAAWILRDQPGWNPETIAAAAMSGSTTRVLVEQELPVVILYLTAYVDDETGDVHFARDIYELDSALLTATAQQ